MFTVADDVVDLSEFRGNCQTQEPCVGFGLLVFRWTKGNKALPWFYNYAFSFKLRDQGQAHGQHREESLEDLKSSQASDLTVM